MIKPIGDRVVLRREKMVEKSPGGLFLPANAQEKSLEAIVVAVGSGVKSEIHKDDRVLVGKYSGTELTLNGQELLVIREDEIIGVL